MSNDFGPKFEAHFNKLANPYDIRGFVTGGGMIVPLGTDTKVLSTVFESIARPVVKTVADELGLLMHEAEAQNSYPDFTLMKNATAPGKIAVDVKTTYRATEASSISFTLGSYTSFLRDEARGIQFPYSQYSEHWIVAFVYARPKVPVPADVFELGQLQDVPKPFDDAAMFARLKWEVAGDKAGSGNTANIGSRRGTFDDLRQGPPLFKDDAEFLSYWRTYERTAALRAETYADVKSFRDLREASNDD